MCGENMEYLGKVEKFVLGYLWFDYFGKIYFSRGSQEAEEFLADTIASDIAKDQRMHSKISSALKEAIKKLKEYWMIEVSGYEVSLTSYGEQVAKALNKDEYNKIKEEIASGRI